MARIKYYKKDEKVTERDILLGSDRDDYGKTKNFPVKALADFIEKEISPEYKDVGDLAQRFRDIINNK